MTCAAGGFVTVRLLLLLVLGPVVCLGEESQNTSCPEKNNDCTCKHETIMCVNVKWAKQAEGRGRFLQADPEVLPVHCSRTAGAPKQAAL